MASTDIQFAGSIPTLYEEILVPLLFQPYAEDLAARLSDLKEGVVLELAAGTGAVTRVLRRTLPPAVRILATDLNEGMIAVGSKRVADPTVTWAQANAQSLPLSDGSADAMVCQFGVMFFPDRPASYREARRVLRSGGRYLFSVWDRLDENPLSRVVNDAVGSLFPESPSHFFERTPFGHHDVSVIRRELEGAGFGQVSIETVKKVTYAPTAEGAARGMCQGTPFRGEIEARGPTRLEDATRVTAEALAARYGKTHLENRMSAHVVTAVAP
ncbi:MAG TPA: class I SAM-dependent methyltransferase [Polyangiaceae bacterium]|nr:class I SAM-dependent methyltransferase [Polyangiaceae bacterium]